MADVDLAQVPQVQCDGHQANAQHNRQAVLQQADFLLIEKRALRGLLLLGLVAVQVVEFKVLAGKQADAGQIADRVDNLASGHAARLGMICGQYLRFA